MRNRRNTVVWVVLALALLIVGWAGGRPRNDGPPLDPRSHGPLGTAALVEVARRLGADVTISSRPPNADDDVAVVLRDTLDEPGAARLRSWVRAGGTLVLADPGSTLAPTPAQTSVFEGLVDEPAPRGTCDIAALRGVDEFDPVGGIAWSPEAGDRTCFGDREAAFVLDRPVGSGHLVAIGGAGAFVNAELDRADNGPVAAALLVPRRGVQLLVLDEPPGGGGSRGLRDLIASNVERALVQLVLAFVLYALFRARRLGAPVPEEQPVVIAGSELVVARGELLHQARSPSHAAAIMRGAARHELAARLGAPLDDSAPDALVDVIVARTALAPEVVRGALVDAPVASDADLVSLARSIEAVRQEVLHGHAVAQPEA